MAFEQFKNTAITQLTGGSINNSSNPVTFTVSSATAFPATGNFRILIDSELMKVTSVSGTSFTAARAQEGTTIATHANGATVTHILTAASLLQLMADFNLSGTFANRPAAGVAGRRYQATDCPFWYLDNGATWDKYFGSYLLITPDDSGFSWVNQGSSALTTTKDMLTLTPVGTSVNSFSGRTKTVPSPPYTITATFLIAPIPSCVAFYQLGFRQSSDGKQDTIAIVNSGANLNANRYKWNSATSFNTSYLTSNPFANLSPLLFLRIVDDNTNRIVKLSSDGINFATYHSIGRTDFLTADQVCWSAAVDGGSTSTISLIHWKEE
jgi:hypothetical protein